MERLSVLLFQNTLEVEYVQAAREKGNVWRKEKASKATMGYTRRMWLDSLPSGSDHCSVTQNIHQHLRKWTPYFDLVKRRPISVKRNLLLSRSVV